jgi:Geranylgeranyl pyrophosphate synthase
MSALQEDPAMKKLKERVEAALEQFLPAEQEAPHSLHQAMRYSVLTNGKRLRPQLTYHVGQALGVSLEILDYPACAVELIHAFSLIHDDLPALDDDALRRGKPTCHIAFGESTAILAGDALQALAFEVIAQTPQVSPGNVLAMIKLLASHSGSRGLIGGEMLDIEAEEVPQSQAELEKIYALKTGHLIATSLMLGALAADKSDNQVQLDALYQAGFKIGIAFQIQDDLLEYTSDVTVLGKSTTSDLNNNKTTYASLLGIEQAQTLKAHYFHQALEQLKNSQIASSAIEALFLRLVERSY